MRKKIKEILGRPVLKNMMVYALTDGLSRAIPFLIMPVIALYLNPAEFGIASNYLIFTQAIGAFISLSTNSYYAVDYYRTPPEKKAAFLSNLIIVNAAVTLLCFVVVLFTTGYLRSFFVITLEWQLLGCLMMFFSAVTDMLVTYLRMEEKLKLYAYYQFLTSISSAGLTLLFVVVFLMSWQGRVLALVISNFILFVTAAFIFAKKDLLRFSFDKKSFVESLKFGIPLLPHKLSTWVKGGFDRVVITKKMGVYDTGLFSFGANISSAVTLFVTSFFGAFTPYVYKQLKIIEDDATKDLPVKKSIVKKCYIAILAFLLLLVLCYFSLTWIIKLFFDQSYQKALLYFPFFFIAIFFNFLYGFVSIFIFYSKKTKFLGLFSIGVSLIQASSTIPLVNLYGTLGASYSLLIGSAFKAIIIGIYSQRVYAMPWLYSFKRIH